MKRKIVLILAILVLIWILASLPANKNFGQKLNSLNVPFYSSPPSPENNTATPSASVLPK